MFASSTESKEVDLASLYIQKIGKTVKLSQILLNEASALPLIGLIESDPISEIANIHETQKAQLRALMISLLASEHLIKIKLAIQKIQLLILRLSLKYAKKTSFNPHSAESLQNIFKKFSDLAKNLLLPMDEKAGYFINQSTLQATWNYLENDMSLKSIIFLVPLDQSLNSYLSQFDSTTYDFTRPSNCLKSFTDISDLEKHELEVFHTEYIEARSAFAKAIAETESSMLILVDKTQIQKDCLAPFSAIFLKHPRKLAEDLLNYADEVRVALKDSERIDPHAPALIHSIFANQAEIGRISTSQQADPKRVLFGEKIHQIRSILPNTNISNPYDLFHNLDPSFSEMNSMVDIDAIFQMSEKEYRAGFSTPPRSHSKKMPLPSPTNINTSPSYTSFSQMQFPANTPASRARSTGKGLFTKFTSATAALKLSDSSSSLPVVEHERFSFSDYLKFYKCKLFGTHHKKRMVALSAALNKLDDHSARTQLLERMLDLLEGKQFQKTEAIFEEYIDARWTTRVDRNAVGKYEESGCYKAILQLRNQLNIADPPRLAPKT